MNGNVYTWLIDGLLVIALILVALFFIGPFILDFISSTWANVEEIFTVLGAVLLVLIIIIVGAFVIGHVNSQ